MAKPIYLSEDVIEKMTLEFKDKLRKAKMSDGKIDYTQKFTYKDSDERVVVSFKPFAYLKMIMLINSTNDEIAWHGTVTREGPLHFTIHDIMVYPQEVTGATVNTDQEEYQTWLICLDDDTANSMHMQGHSHVNMGVFASTTDMYHQEQILSQIEGDEYYIFMIWNKKMEHNVCIYDLANNTLYEKEDIVVQVEDPSCDLSAFIADALSKVKKKSYTTAGKSSAYGGSSYSSQNYGGAYGGNAYGGSSYGGHSAAPNNASGKKDNKSAKGDKKSKLGKARQDFDRGLPLECYDDEDFDYSGIVDLDEYARTGKK